MHRLRWPDLLLAAVVGLAWFACVQVLSRGRGLTDGLSAPPLAARHGPQGVAVVDSLRPVAVELARFRAALGRAAPRGLEGGTPSRDALLASFVGAVERQDHARLSELVLNAAEFAWYYYPFTVHTHAPYTQAPQVVWLLSTESNRKGASRLLRRFGGRPLDYRGYRCASREPQDLNVLHTGCTVLLGSEQMPHELFGTIIERDGRFKFVSYANTF